jgi:hypothetical protein
MLQYKKSWHLSVVDIYLLKEKQNRKWRLEYIDVSLFLFLSVLFPSKISIPVKQSKCWVTLVFDDDEIAAQPRRNCEHTVTRNCENM